MNFYEQAFVEGKNILIIGNDTQENNRQLRKLYDENNGILTPKIVSEQYPASILPDAPEIDYDEDDDDFEDEYEDNVSQASYVRPNDLPQNLSIQELFNRQFNAPEPELEVTPIEELVTEENTSIHDGGKTVFIVDNLHLSRERMFSIAHTNLGKYQIQIIPKTLSELVTIHYPLGVAKYAHNKILAVDNMVDLNELRILKEINRASINPHILATLCVPGTADQIIQFVQSDALKSEIVGTFDYIICIDNDLGIVSSIVLELSEVDGEIELTPLG